MAEIKLTGLGKDIIPAELVGQNIDYRILGKIAKPAYPNGEEVRYSDDYVCSLNRIYSLDEVLGVHVENIAQRRGLERFVMDSPLQNNEGEYILARMLISSAQAGQWQPFIIDVPCLTDTSIATAEDYLKKIESISPDYHRGMADGGVLCGIAIAKRGGLVLPIEYDNKVVVVPTQAFLEYTAKKK